MGRFDAGSHNQAGQVTSSHSSRRTGWVLRLAISLAISLAALAYVVAKLDFSGLWSLLRQLNPLYIPLVWCMVMLSYLLRAWRWSLLIRPVKEARVGVMFSAVLIGFMANNLLPARLGELVRAYAAKRLLNISLAASLGSLVVERVLDSLNFLLLIFGALLLLDPSATVGGFSTAYFRGAAYSLLAVYLAVVALVWLLRHRPKRIIQAIAGLAGRISPNAGDKTDEVLTAFNQGMDVLGRGRRLPGLLALSLLVVLPMLASYTLFLPAVGLPLDPHLGALALVGAAMGASIPAGPGHIGTFQLGIMGALLLAGAPEQPAAAFGLLYWAICFVGVVLAGWLALWRAGLKGLFGNVGGTFFEKKVPPTPPSQKL